MKQADRISEVRQLFVQRYPEKERTGNAVLAFHGWLMQNRWDLLDHGGEGDHSYQHLKSDLDGLFKD